MRVRGHRRLAHNSVRPRGERSTTEADCLTNEKVARRHCYTLSATAMLRHPPEQTVEVSLLLDLFRHASDEPVSSP